MENTNQEILNSLVYTVIGNREEKQQLADKYGLTIKEVEKALLTFIKK